MGWKDKLAAKAADAAKVTIGKARDKIENQGARSRLSALRGDQPITIETLLLLLVNAVREDFVWRRLKTSFIFMFWYVLLVRLYLADHCRRPLGGRA